MKKVITMILCVCLISMLTVPVLAAQTATMSVSASKTTVNRGDMITVTIGTSSLENCVSGGFMFEFDQTAFTYVSGSSLPGLGGYTAGVSTAAGNVAGYFMNGNATVQGSIFQITLKVKDSAAYGTYIITGTPSLTNADGAVSCGVSATSVTVACKHNYSNWTDAGNGKHSRTCSICADEESANHTWNGTVIKAATCREPGVKNYSCTACNASKAESVAKLTTHTYDNACDPDCNICGSTRTTTHNYKTSWSSDKTNHWHECSVCRHKKDVVAHTPGAEATEIKAQSCTACGYVIKPSLGHKHSYAAVWSSNEAGHWYPCSGCAEKGSYDTHDFENTCDKECAVCGYTRKTSHKFTEVWTTDGSSHWRECTGCGLKQDEAAHKPGPEATKTSAQTCTVCGYVLTRALVSEKTAEEKKDETQLPTVQENIPKAEHTTYTQENIPDKEGFPMWILIVASVIVLSAVVILVKKKKT